jgi:hypothetical protein
LCIIKYIIKYFLARSRFRTKTIEKEKKKRRLRLKNFFIRDKNKNNEEAKEVKSSTLKRNQTREKSSSRHLEPSDTDQVKKQKIAFFPQSSVFTAAATSTAELQFFFDGKLYTRSTRRRVFRERRGSTPCTAECV